MGKSISKKLVDKIINLVEMNRCGGPGELYELAIYKAMELQDGDRLWCAYLGIINSIVGVSGLSLDATNEDIYKVFSTIGVDVIDDMEVQDE